MRVKFLIAIFAFSALLGGIVNAQRRELSKADFDALLAKGDSFLSAEAHRVKINSERYSATDSQNPSSRSAQTAEFQPPDRRRAIFSFTTSARVTQLEIVEIGKNRFKRSDNGSWIEGNNDSQYRYTIKGDIADHKKAQTFKKLGSLRLSGIKASGYESNTTSEYQSPNLKSEYVERIWFDKKGRLLKREEWTTENGKLLSHVLYEYEYDSKIQIEAPIE